MTKLHLIGCASGAAGADIHSGDGPLTIENSVYLSELKAMNVDPLWHAMLKFSENKNVRLDEAIAAVCFEIANISKTLSANNQFFTLIGGDHSCAIGTWSGVFETYHKQGDIGLIWVDAHMDSHTPETTESGRIHGMPLACLLGYGYPALTSVMNFKPKLKPENLCLIGVRSFEKGEADFLKRLNVRIYFMEEVERRGLDEVVTEAIEHVSKHTIGFGLSLDLDGIDPNDAPGVDVPEPNGISAEAMLQAVDKMAANPKLLAAEIVEFDPVRDRGHQTEKLVVELLKRIAKHRV